MPTIILTTKLYIPPPRPKIVLRHSLIERLNKSLSSGCKLTLISAPAGFGKTTMISEWVAGCGRPAAWLSLDDGDNNLTLFLTYLVAALQTLLPKIGAGVLAVLQSPQTPPVESILTTLLNEIAGMPHSFILVLDDYHLIDSQGVDQALVFLLEHLPPQMHLVIATREDPHLPLARLRGQGKLTELRAADLRFTSSEAADFLNQQMGLNLSAEDIAALEARTEGWIAGLQLAGIALRSPHSLHERSDTAGFIQSFTGSHRFVVDYLVEEVLQRQSAPTRSFLLQTAILDRFCAPLCNAVTEREDGKEMLDMLERSNLFLIPLDDQRHWYRYHHLFAGVLHTHLMDAQPERVSSLHLRASVWLEQNDLSADAIRHALVAEDFERAAGLIELAWSAMDLSYQSSTWLGWVQALPDGLMRDRPVLSVGYAWALLAVGELESSVARLQDAERLLDTSTEKMVFVDKEQFRSLPASIATARAYRSLALGNVPDTVKYAQQAFELTPEDDLVRYNQATSLLGLAQYAGGDLEAAERSLTDFCTNLQKTGDFQTLIGITFLLADIRVALGRLHEAESRYQQTIRLATSQGEPMPLGTADLYRGLGELYIEWNDLEAAAQHLLTSQKLGEQTALTDWEHRLCVSQARLKEAMGDLDGALALLDEAERLYIRSPLPNVRPIEALKVRLWLMQGRLAKTLGWAREQGLSADNDILYAREFEHITLAQMLIAAGKSDREAGPLDEATQLLGRLLQAAETGGRLGSAIQILLLQALAFQAQENLPSALEVLERALALGEPEGYVRIFVDEGEAMRSLLEKLSRDRNHPLSGYTHQLLAAFTQPGAAPKPAITPRKSGMIEPDIQPTKSMLVEPISERELEVLRLLRSELSGPEIARQLIVSLNTLRTHTKNIFNKLGVNNRRAAIRRAEELDLF
jgi:LuxR family transcriptional regulator, maltose regulon positive regulatory protein